MSAQSSTTAHESAAQVDIVLTGAGSHPDAVACKLLELASGTEGYPLVACTDLVKKICEIVPAPTLQTSTPNAELARQSREQLAALFNSQLPRAIAFAASPKQGEGASIMFRAIGATIQLAASDPAQGVAWQSTGSVFDLILTREGRSLETLTEIRRLTGLGFARAKELIGSLPQIIKVGLSESEAENLEQTFDQLGAEVQLVRRQGASVRRASVETVGTLSHFDQARIDTAAAKARELNDPFEELKALGAIYTTMLRPAWHAYADNVETFASRVRLAKEAEELSIRNEGAKATMTAEQAFADDVAADNKKLAKINDDQRTFVDKSDSLVKSIWEKFGSGLGLLTPEGLLSSGEVMRPSQDTEVDDSTLSYAQEAYASSCHAVERFSAMGPFGKDASVKRFFLTASWASGILFVILWIGSGFLTALIMAALLFGGTMLIPAYSRSTAAEAYKRLVSEMVRVQTLRELRARKEAAVVARRVEERRSELNNAKNAIDKLSAEKLAVTKEKYAGNARDGRDNFARSRKSCGELLARLTSAIKRAIAERSANYGLLDGEAPAEPVTASPFADSTRFRFGQIVPTPLAKPNSEAIAVLDLAGEVAQPLALASMVPWFWEFAGKRSLFVMDKGPAIDDANSPAKILLARILGQIPPGKVNLTLFDPIGLGRNFSEFLKLADYSEQLISGRVWSDREHIHRKLKDLIEHIETVTQKYLRNDFPDIETYNAHAGEIAEPYRLLVIADFPESFDEEASRDLVRIVQNGPRCGVFAIIHANLKQKMPHGVDLEALRPFCIELMRSDDDLTFGVAAGGRNGGTPGAQEPVIVKADGAASEAVVNAIVARFGGGAQKAMRVEVSYKRLLGMAGIVDDGWWEHASANGIEVPLGPTGAKKVQVLRLGTGLAHHALLVGRPGSGKSNLIHVFITTVARLYPPDEVQLYLIDFKKGVEFKCYAEAKLPHARVIAVESEREFGLSVLEGLDSELKVRGEKFRASGSANIAEYRNKTREKLPRIVLIVDEFQEFFTRDDPIKREAAVLFDRLVRQGRAFGVHLVLGTQSLANAGLERATQDQMAVRIALQCSEADSRLILGEDNTAARLLSRPGEAIFNDAAGLIEGNNLFQVAMFSEEDRSRELEAVNETAIAKSWQGDPPVVFEGHEAAQIMSCRPLAQSLLAVPATEVKTLQLWLGEPTSLRPTVAVPLKRQSGRNLMILTRDEEQGVGVMLAALLSLAAQSRPGRDRFAVVDLTSADAPWADHPEEFASAVPHHVEVLGRRDLKSILRELGTEVERRGDGGLMKEPTIVLVLLGLQRARELRQGDDMGGASISMDLNSDTEVGLPQRLASILREGPEVGVHTLLWCDTYANLERALDRSAVNEIGLRISGPLAASESHRLFDDDVASLIDKPHRMLKYDDDQVGAFELFRPYGVAPVDFIASFGKSLGAAIAAE
jgi:ribosomal protein L7/L12